MLNLGTVRACPVCKRGNVIVRSIVTRGPTEVVVNWGDPNTPTPYEQQGEAESFYKLDCGHTVSEEDVRQEEAPKFVRWCPEEK